MMTPEPTMTTGKPTTAPPGGTEPELTRLSGQVRRVTYADEESGFTVAKVQCRNEKETVTVVGELMSPAEGTILHMYGQWSDHSKFGRQFKVVRFTCSIPANRKALIRYLSSGAVRGIGQTTARRIVKKFGKKTLEILESDIERLIEVNGIGASRLAMIRQSWEEQKEVRNVMLFLQGHGIGAGTANKIFRHYGQQTIAVLKENPYRLADDIFGIGFIRADQIARELGFDANSPLRIRAGVLYVLNESTSDGHVYFPYDELIGKAGDVLDAQREMIVEAIGALAAEKQIVIEDLNESADNFKPNHKAVYLSLYHYCEAFVARALRMIAGAPVFRPGTDVQRALTWVQHQLNIDLAEAQRKAVGTALTQKVMVITGGPGTGKTTIIQAITRLYRRMNATVLLAAPTGRAAKRLSEATGRTAKTIHRLLEFSPTQGGFQRNEHHPLNAELVIVDEASMIDTILMHYLLKAMPTSATLILVGDVNQLPSVGPGNVLKDIIASGFVPVATLDQIFRQARNSRIVVNAHRMNAGQMPVINVDKNALDTDFYFIEQEDPEKVLELILTLISERIPRRFGLDPMDDIQVLSPMHRGVVGTENLNRQLQKTLNPQQVYVKQGDHRLQVNEKVMQVRNNYEKDVFNGDIGRIAAIDSHDKKVTVRFDDRIVPYEFSELDELSMAYAVSVHKSQGSEFPAVIIPVTTQHYVLLQRNLIYTAVTRARKLVVLVGTRRALAIAVNNNKTQRRYTRLDRRLSFG